MKLDKIINSPIVLLILGFFLTGVIGSFLNNRIQEETWKRQERYELLKRELDESRNVIENTLLDANKRFYAMQKVLWSLESFDLEEAKRRWEEYNEIKDNWNITIGSYRSKMKILIGPELAYELLDKEDAKNYKNKESLHAMFVVAHYKLKDLYNTYEVKESLNMLGSPPEHSKELELEALNALTELGNYMSDFSDKCYNTYTIKYESFEQEILDK